MIEIMVLASGSRGNCYRVTDGSTPLLLECGIKYKEIQRGLDFKVSELAGCLISHEHKDHSRAARDLIRAGVDLYASIGTLGELGLAGHRVHELQAKTFYNIGTWTVLPFVVKHDAEDPMGFLLANQAGDKLLYITDTYYVRYKFRDLTHIMVECNYAADILRNNVETGEVPGALKNRVLKSHFSLEHVKQFLQANDLSRVQEVWLLHLSDGNSSAERFKREIQELTGKPVYIAGD